MGQLFVINLKFVGYGRLDNRCGQRLSIFFHNQDTHIRTVNFLRVSVVLLVLMENNLVSLLVKELVFLVILHVVVFGICIRGSVLWPLVSKILLRVVILPLVA